jgi:hypothetical protein
MPTTQLPLPGVGIRPTRSRSQKITDYIDKHNLDVQFAGGCCEPDYDDKPVALANWNSKSEYNQETKELKTIDNIMPRLAKVLEKMGYAIEWQDEWHTCDNCGKAVRSSADSYSWKRYFWIAEDCNILCGNCVKSDPTDYLDFLSGNPEYCLTFDIDLSKYGYRKYAGDFENGWYHRSDNPEIIAKQLRECEGITDFIFVLDEMQQFCIHFSVWVKNES